MNVRMGAVALAFGLVGVAAVARGQATAPAGAAEEIAATIDTAIGLLEKEKYAELLEMLMPPAEYARVKKSEDWDQFYSDFSKKKGKILLEELKKVRGTPAVVNEDKTKAKVGVIVFEKLEGKWRMAK